MARHKRLHVEMAIIKMTYIGRAIELSQNPAAVQSIEKKTPDLSNQTASVPKQVIAPTSKTIPQKMEEQKMVDASPPVVPTEKVASIQNRPEVSTVSANAVNTSTPVISDTTRTKNISNRKKTKYDMPSLSMVDDEEEEESTIDSNIQLEALLLANTWKAYAEKIDSPSVKAAFHKAEVSVKDELTIAVQVGSQMAKGMIQQEKDLIPFIRKHIPIANLAMEETMAGTASTDFLPLAKHFSKTSPS